MKRVALAFGILLFTGTISYAGDVHIGIGFSVPVPMPPPVVVFPPLPPGIVIVPGRERDYWFWDDGRGAWFYYDSYRRPHYVRRHAYRDDGRHFYRDDGRWRPRYYDRGWRGRGDFDDRDGGRDGRHRDRDRDGRHRDRDRDRDGGHGRHGR